MIEKSFPRQLKLRLVTTNRAQLDRRFGCRLPNGLCAIKKRGAPAVHNVAPRRHPRFAGKIIVQDESKHHRQRAVIRMRVGDRRNEKIRRRPVCDD